MAVIRRAECPPCEFGRKRGGIYANQLGFQRDRGGCGTDGRRSSPLPGALAEEIWSANFCQQAVSLAQQHGESPQALNQVDCQGMADNYQPSYWQCVLAALKADARLKLEVARQKCLVGY